MDKIRLVPKDDPLDNIQVEIGDLKQADFYPQVKIMRWDNEVNLSARLVDSFAGEPVISQEGDKIKWVKPGIESNFYPNLVSEIHPEGGFEFEIVLKEKPVSNKLQFTIRTKGLDFFYQPSLTQKEVDAGNIRPENVVGSYAVYHSEKKGDRSQIGGKNYRAGKAFHIFRPRVKDAVGREIWADLRVDIVNQILEITIDQNFLNGAVYPVLIDPNFGYETAGASSGDWAGNLILGSLFTSPSDVLTATSMTISCMQDQAASLKGVLVLHSNLSIITNGVGDAVAAGTTKAWKTSPFSTPPNLSVNTDYVLMAIASAYWYGYNDIGAENQGHTDGSNNYTTPTNPTDATHTGQLFSIYCTYTLPPPSIPVLMNYYRQMRN